MDLMTRVFSVGMLIMQFISGFKLNVPSSKTGVGKQRNNTSLAIQSSNESLLFDWSMSNTFMSK